MVLSLGRVFFLCESMEIAQIFHIGPRLLIFLIPKRKTIFTGSRRLPKRQAITGLLEFVYKFDAKKVKEFLS